MTEEEHDNLGVDWVLQYEFGDIDQTQAVTEFREMMHDLTEAGLRVQVRHGHGAIKDWLYGISHNLPIGDENTTASAESPAEELRTVYHAVTWCDELGGAGVTPKHGKWERVTASFPLHDKEACSQLLREWSRKTILTTQDLNTIRALFGEKVAYYYAFIHCYSLFLTVPAAMGIIGWLYLGPYSIIYGAGLCVWCVVFVEYWKIREQDLSLRWNVKGVAGLKVNRPEFKWEKEVPDPISGQPIKAFPQWKQFLRQLLLVPFASIASVALGSLIVIAFASEVFISEVYSGPMKGYLEFAPTIIFSLSLPAITSFLNSIATRLTEYENYRTQDLYDLALTQKNFVMNFITSFLPTILTAYIYVPFAQSIVPHLDILRRTGLNVNLGNQVDFKVDTSRFQQEVIYLSMTAQVLDFGEEIVLPYVKQILWEKWRNYRDRRDGFEEANFLARVRKEADADEYKVEEDILEMCVQFGYLALFGVAWPLVPLGFLLNSWLELRGDFFKLTLECQRPPPIRADSIGPSVLGLELLAWLGTLSTAAIVHLYRGPMSEVRLSYLLLTVFLAEQAYLAVRFTASTALQKIYSDTLRQEEAKRYAVRRSFLEASANAGRGGSPGSVGSRVRHVRFHEKVNVYNTCEKEPSPDGSRPASIEEAHDDVLRGSDREADFWNAITSNPADIGVKMIRAISISKDEKLTKKA
ncbi:hypothetical protein N7470_006561 [Penicillium chermesinum]|nr:hypothetical protein N7470_006561 [Penicillium chermesinum]